MPEQKLFRGVTLHGLPVQIELDWPFHASAGGSDWYVVHGRVTLADGGPLHADVALNLAQTIREVLPSLDGELAYWVAINTARKALDDRQMELLKSGKRQPVSVSSRSYSIRHKHFRFLKAGPEQLRDFVARKVFWVSGPERNGVLVTDPCDAQYLDATDTTMVDKLGAAAQDLTREGLLQLQGEYARPTEALVAEAQVFHSQKDQALEQLQLKHAFERG